MRRLGKLAPRIVAVATLLVCGASTGLTPAHAGTPSGTVRPRVRLTPGVLDPDVRQSTIHETICVSGWTKTIRPPVGYTNRLKLTQMVAYGEAGSPSAYEEDHFIPLELGGAPRDPHNLWPEPREQARRSDPLETHLKFEVCDGTITLAQARNTIRAYKRAHG